MKDLGVQIDEKQVLWSYSWESKQGIYTVSKKCPKLTGYRLNIYPPIFTIGLTYIHQFLQFLDMSSAEIQKLAAGKTFSNTSLLLTL